MHQNKWPSGRGGNPTSHIVKGVKGHSSAHAKPAKKGRNYVAAAASSRLSRETQAESHSPTDDMTPLTATVAHASTKSRSHGRGWATATSSSNCAASAKQKPSKSVCPAEASRSNCATGAKQEPSRGGYAAAAAAEQAASGTVRQAREGDRQLSCCATAIKPQPTRESCPPPVNHKAQARRSR